MSKGSLRYRIGVFGIGLLGNYYMVVAFDGLLYPKVMLWYTLAFGREAGALHGLLTMTFLSYFVCRLTMMFYDWAKQDWLMIESIKAAEGELSKEAKAVRVFLLALATDPFITTAYARTGAHRYDGMSRRDWMVFLFSLVVGNVFWATIVLTSLAAFEGELYKVIILATALTFVMPFIGRWMVKAVS